MSSLSENESAKAGGGTSPPSSQLPSTTTLHPTPTPAAAQQQQQQHQFPVGPVGKRELRNALKNTNRPQQTIRAFQQSHSLHTMLAQAFDTIPMATTTHQKQPPPSPSSPANAMESFDSNSVLTFLSHLQVPQYQVHKRISDTLIQELCEEIRQTTLPTNTTASTTTTATFHHSDDSNNIMTSTTTTKEEMALYDLLKSCWIYATTIAELRPIVWSILKQLGSKTPLPVLLALTERDDTTTTTISSSSHTHTTTAPTTHTTPENRLVLKHAEIYKPLSLLLKQLCWEVDWDHRLPTDHYNYPEPPAFLSLAQGTLLYDTVQGDIQDYIHNTILCDLANHPFVTTLSERRMMTTQRRALTKGTTTTGTSGPKMFTSGKAVSHLRYLLCSSSIPHTSSSGVSSSGGGGGGRHHHHLT
jgi:hypothetical protein